MTSLVTVAEARVLVNTNLDDAELQAVIDRQEAEVIRSYGAHYVNGATAVSETLEGGGKNLFLCRPLTSIKTVTEDDVALTSIDYRLWGNQGRLERRPAGSVWGEVVVVSYIPADDNTKRKSAIIELVRLAVEQTAMKSESIGGEYSYTAPDWEEAQGRVMRSLGFAGV